MKIILITLLTVSGLAQTTPGYNPYSQALGLPQPNVVVVAPLQPLGTQPLQQQYITSLIIQQNAQAQINQEMANEALKQNNPNYVKRDYIREQSILHSLLNAK